ncbi:MAG: DUF962 domain-containing protein [Rehaibacterium terrae]|jgi:uncharacterized membrane protein YGL010W|uniref:Mpo1 family 2-hydroxy fatty acid dioxygenase n=1 Tax=Rehaibacterium terrae TaxID=1341696 RepID=UPI00391997AB
MRSIHPWLEKYGEDHQHPTNQAIHLVCVPLIVWSVIALLWTVPVPTAFARPGAWAGAACFFALLFYWPRSRALGAGIFVAFALMLYGCHLFVAAFGMQALLYTAIAVFVLAWIGQFIGHRIEGRKPSFFTDLVYLLIGPAWTLSKLYRKLGWSY